jgi:hypothetical protein
MPASEFLMKVHITSDYVPTALQQHYHSAWHPCAKLLLSTVDSGDLN